MELSEDGQPVLDCQHDPSVAYVITDLRLSRQYSFHAAILPGQPEPRWCKTLEQVAWELQHADIKHAILCAAGQHWRLTLEPE